MFWLIEHQAAIAIVLSVAALSWQFVQFVITHNSDAKTRQFEAYHRLIKELVKPEDGSTYVDRQCAAIFELVRFKQYRPLTIRILSGLREDWRHHENFHARLATELDIALAALGGQS
jgi:hypothetical protein